MSHYESNIDVAGLCRQLRQCQRVAVTSHAKPDGDAFGSVVALCAALRALGVDATPWLIPPVPTHFRLLRGWPMARLYEPGVSLGQPDRVVVLDTGAWSQVADLRQELTRLLDRTVIVDHHLTGDIPASQQYIDAGAAACCEIVAEMVEHLAAEAEGEGEDLFSPTVCDALFVGLATDTGWFRFSNTHPGTHELAARLLRKGVDHAQLYAMIEQSDRLEKLALITRALDSVKIIADGRAAVMVLRDQDFIESGAVIEETERLVDIPQMVSSVQLVVLVTQPPRAGAADASSGDDTRLSFRSKPAAIGMTPGGNPGGNPGGTPGAGAGAVDVSRLAAQFGGGGHARAAGAKVDAPVDTVVEQVIQRVTAAMAEATPNPRQPPAS